MAADAVANIPNPFLRVFGLGGALFVADIAGIDAHSVRVTSPATVCASLAMIDWEFGMRQTELRRSPSSCAVAGCAVRAQGSGVEAGLCMAVRACGGRTDKDAVLVTLRAGELSVSACQREAGPAMIKGGVLPSRRLMALLALLSKASLMSILVSVTRKTARWCAFEHAIHVALSASHSGVSTDQGER